MQVVKFSTMSNKTYQHHVLSDTINLENLHFCGIFKKNNLNQMLRKIRQNQLRDLC